MTHAPSDRTDATLLVQIGVVLLGGIMGILNSSMVTVGNHAIATQFGSSVSTLGWVSTGYLLALTVTIPVTAWAVDRVGGKRLWLGSLVLFLAASVACGLAWDIGSLIFFRVVQGIGAGVLDPLVLVLLARAAGPARAGRVMGLMGLVLSLGPVLGPVLGGAVLQGFGWRSMFMINLPIIVIAFLLALRFVPEDQPGAEQHRDRLDVVGLALVGPGIALLVLALSQAAERGAFGAWQVVVPLVLGLVLVVGYGVKALGARKIPPLVDLRLFLHRGFTVSVAVMGLSGIANFAVFFALPLYYQKIHGTGASESGLLIAPLGLGAAAAMPLAGRLSDKLGSRTLAVAGALVALVAVFGFTQIDGDTNQLWTVVAGLASGLGMGFVGAPAMGAMYRTLPPHLVPQGSSVLYMLNQLGASVGIAAAAFILQTVGSTTIGGFHATYWFAFGATVVVLIGALLISDRATPTGGDRPVVEEREPTAG
ncbi:DHA2 family efflux MFS transporter permease subunit [Saccharothrix obliqua]|uniref:DHA2 family efflux MFS transporter permease subunit n=1 Tax=Saccharothrix obliqua TaxID=2861747 RepID=UPI001C5FAAFD|nr:DHA2 family efflux MFS transporter permease subunit [Saccharothrix obliqua]MBW4722358.1 DHA2 family efflux MFS transporter permease subunit [Saccharothrix obliqua]